MNYPPASFPSLFKLTPFSKIKVIHQRCELHIHRANEFYQRATSIATCLKGEEKEEGEHFLSFTRRVKEQKQKIKEYKTRAKFHEISLLLER